MMELLRKGFRSSTLFILVCAVFAGAPTAAALADSPTTTTEVSSRNPLLLGQSVTFAATMEPLTAIPNVSGPTTTTVVSARNPSLLGQSVTFTATVEPLTAIPNVSGTVTFTDGTSVLGTAPLSSGSAGISTSALTVGTHSISAAFGGADGYAPSTSAPLSQTVLTAGGCSGGDDTTACVGSGGRFRVTVDWINQYGGTSGVGHAYQLTSETGTFWFFVSTNIELLVKVLDGRGVNGKFWVLYGALSDVEYTITITDTMTSNVKTYHNPAGTMASVADVSAFPGSPSPAGASDGTAAAEEPDWLSRALAAGEKISISGLMETPGAASEEVTRIPEPLATTCTPDDTTLCLNLSRFFVKVGWTNYNTGNTGTGKTIPVTSDSGCFWFFSPTNIELAVKILDGRGVNGKYWVLYGALSDVGYTITIGDTVTGTVKSYVNPPHTMASAADTVAFDP